MWPFSSNRLQPCFCLGNYRLDSNISCLSELTELSPEEFRSLNRTVQFEGERLYHAPPAEFLGQSWDTVLGTVHGRIYKIALQLTGLTRSNGGAMSRAVLVFVTKQQGRRPKSEGPVFFWDTADGNIVFHDAWLGNELVLNLFLTSGKIRNFQRIQN